MSSGECPFISWRYLGAFPVGPAPPLRESPGGCPLPTPSPRPHPRSTRAAAPSHSSRSFPYPPGQLLPDTTRRADDTVRGHKMRPASSYKVTPPWSPLGRLRATPWNDRQVTRKALLGLRIDGSGRSETPPATSLSLFTANGSIAKDAEPLRSATKGAAKSALTNSAFSWKFARKGSKITHLSDALCSKACLPWCRWN